MSERRSKRISELNNKKSFLSEKDLDYLLKESELMDTMIFNWEDEYKNEKYLQKKNCIYACLVVIRKPFLKNGQTEIAICLKLGYTDRPVYKRLREEFNEYNLVYIIPIMIMQGKNLNIKSIESKIHEKLKKDSCYQVQIGCQKRSNIVIPREFYIVNNVVLDTIYKLCIKNKMKEIHNTRPKKDQDFFENIFDIIPCEFIAEQYGLNLQELLLLDDLSDNLTDKQKTELRQYGIDNISNKPNTSRQYNFHNFFDEETDEEYEYEESDEELHLKTQ